jgi:Ca-activated chloride channel family protein
VRNPDPGAAAKVQQPLPLPQGVSNQAIGALVPSTPEPAAWAMLLIAALAMFWASRRRSHAH